MLTIKIGLNVKIFFGFTTLLLGLSVSGCFQPPKAEIPVQSRFVKLDGLGNELSIQNQAWNHSGTVAAGNKWHCIEDKENNLVWEVKQTDLSLHDSRYGFTWFSSDVANNGDEHGVGDTGNLTTTGYEDKYSLAVNYGMDGAYDGSDNCHDLNECDSEKYVSAVNANALCASTSWRLPSRAEFDTLFTCTHPNCGSSTPPHINIEYFPNTGLTDYWASDTATLNFQGDAAGYANFESGYVSSAVKHYINGIRLVYSK